MQIIVMTNMKNYIRIQHLKVTSVSCIFPNTQIVAVQWGTDNKNHLYLKSQQKKESLNTVEASVNKVPHEEIVCLWHISTNLQDWKIDNNLCVSYYRFYINIKIGKKKPYVCINLIKLYFTRSPPSHLKLQHALEAPQRTKSYNIYTSNS